LCRIPVSLLDSGAKARPLSVARRRTKQETNMVLKIVSCCRRIILRRTIVGDAVELMSLVLDV